MEREFDGSLRFQKPVMNAEGSRTLNHEVINMIFQDAYSFAPGFQFHILLLGDNNLRHPPMEPVASFIGKCEYLVQGLSYIPNCHVILVSIIPCPKTNEKFLEANSRLREISHRNFHFVSYLDLERTRFFINGGAINENLFYDGIHLRDEGSEMLAKLIFKHCCSVGKVT